MEADDDNVIAKVDVHFADEDVWLAQSQLAEIYDTTQHNVALHIKLSMRMVN